VAAHFAIHVALSTVLKHYMLVDLPGGGGRYRLSPLLWTIVYAEAVNHPSRAPP